MQQLQQIVNDPDIQFHWSFLTCNHLAAELLSKVICQWLTIRGSSMAAAFMEEYKS
jgi:hypothetical protein